MTRSGGDEDPLLAAEHLLPLYLFQVLSFVCVFSLSFSRDLVVVLVRSPDRPALSAVPGKGPWLPGTRASPLASPPRGDGASERLSRLLDVTALRLLILEGSRELSQHRWPWSS